MIFLKKNIKYLLVVCVVFVNVTSLFAQKSFSIRDYVQLNTVVSNGDNAPFWLVTNRNGVSSLDTQNGYVRYGVLFDGVIGDKGSWKYSAGLDLKAGYNQTSNLFVQQFYADISYKWFTFSFGQKERASEMRHFCNEFSGSVEVIAIQRQCDSKIFARICCL